MPREALKKRIKVFYHYICIESELTEMKLYRILLAAGAAALLLLAGCTREMKTATVADEGKVPMPGGYDASMSYDYRMEYVTGGIPKQVMDKINEFIVANTFYFDDVVDLPDVPTACKDWVEELTGNYEEDASDFAENFDEEDAWIYNWSFSVEGAFDAACKARDWQTYRISSEDYTGGAHGTYGVSYIVFDMKRGETIGEEAFLDTDASEEICDLIYDKILEEIEEEMWDAIYETPTLNGNFRVDDEGVTWFYNPYEIGPYVLGVMEARLSWDELSPYLLAD